MVTADTVAASVTFSEFFLGTIGYVHGGSISLLLDDFLARLANSAERVCMTAYLHVEYRSPTPIGVPLTITAALDRVDGRKRFVKGSLLDGGTVVAEANALFLEIPPSRVHVG